MADFLIERTEHIEGRPVSAGTYQHHGCRCQGCTTASSAATRRSRSKPGSRSNLHVKAQSRAREKAVAWVRDQYPDVWRMWLEESQREVGL